MAGSISHVTADDGSFTFDLIDDLGDAYEACEDLFNERRRLEARIKKLEAELAHLRRVEEAAREMLPALDAELHHTYGYSTCVIGDTVNADRGCPICCLRATLQEHRAALDAMEEE